MKASTGDGATRGRRFGVAVASLMAILALKRLLDPLFAHVPSLPLRRGSRRLETERARREQAEAALRDTHQRTDGFLAALSHELRAPLAAILGWARLLRSTPSNRETIDRALESIERNVRVQTRILDDLQDISRILSGRLHVDVRPTELTPLVASAIEAIQPEAQAKAIRLDTALDPQAGVVAADPERLQQIFWTLVSHAVRATPAGGRVEIQLDGRGPTPEIRVTDSGPGIPSEALPHAFEIFRPTDGAPGHHPERLGLGLAIARHLTELHGGTIRADSPGVGRGTTFTVSFPRASVTE